MEPERIKYRAKTTDGSWLYGIPHKTPLGNWMMRDKEGAGRYIDPDTIGQYTGLKDKDGREIYEGDIVRHTEYKVDRICRWIARHITFAFETEDGSDETYYFQECDTPDLKVIGNIFDNPNLLNKEQ